MVPVINLRNEPKLREAFEYAHVHNNTVLIDRRTKWGNPFKVGVDGSREDVIARYRADLWRRVRAGELSLEELAEIAGCWYACWCLPRPCHGEVLARAAAWAAGILAERDAPQAGGTASRAASASAASPRRNPAYAWTATMSAMSSRSTIRCTRAAGISSYTSMKTRAAPAAFMTATASVRWRSSGSSRIRFGADRYPAGGTFASAIGVGVVGGRKFGRCLRPGLSAAISGRGAPCDFRFYPYRLQSLALLARYACQESGHVRASIADALPGTTAEGGGAWNKQILLRRDCSSCHTCSLRQPRLRRGPPLRCAPLRPGLGMKRR